MSLIVVRNIRSSQTRVFGASTSLALAVGCLLAVLAGCSKSDRTTQAPPEQAASPAAARVPATPMAPIDPCSLLTSEEVAAVQGEAVVGTKPSLNQGRGVAIYDCFFTLPTFTNSVSLSVTQAGAGADAQDPKQTWQETLGAANAKAGEKTGPAQIVEGVGEQAFWTGNERMGALYVLKGSRYLRLSVGGPGDSAAKIEKCRALAEAALKRL